MIEKFLVFMSVIGIVMSIKCYSYLAVSKSEFIDSAETCKTNGACVTVTYKDLIYTDCADDCLAETTKIAKETMKTIAEEGGVILNETDVEVGCCKDDLCSKPTAVAKSAGTQCYEFQGERSEMKENATLCDYGSYCLTATVRNFIVARCVNECSDVNKKITEVAVEAEFDDDESDEPELSEGELKSECCTGHLCNGWYMETRGTTTETEKSTPEATVASTKPTVLSTTTVSSTEATLPSTTPTVSSTGDTVPTTKPTVAPTEGLVPTTKPTVPSTEDTVPTTKPILPPSKHTVASTEGTVPTSSTVPPTKETAPSTKPTVASTEGTVPTTKPTISPTKATVTSTNPTVASSKYTVLSPEPTVASVETTVATKKPTVATKKPTVTTKKPTVASTKPTIGTTKGEGSGGDTGSIIGASTTTNAAETSLCSLPLYSLGLLSIVYSMQ